jgi:hypothetical protein
VTATFTLKNAGSRTVSIAGVAAAARGPNCVVWSCPRDSGFATLRDVTLAPGDVYRYIDSRTFSESGDGYFAQVACVDANGWWSRIGEEVDFRVLANIYNVFLPVALLQ